MSPVRHAPRRVVAAVLTVLAGGGSACKEGRVVEARGTPPRDAGAPAVVEDPAGAPAASPPAGAPAASGTPPTDAAPTPAPAAAAASGAGDAGTSGSTVPAQPELPVTAAVALSGGADVAIARGARTTVDPASAFRVELGVGLVDGRLVLYDDADAMVPSSGESELRASSSRYVRTPLEPLRPGASYALVVEGATSRAPHDGSGRAYRALVLELEAGGERAGGSPRERSGARGR